MEYDFPNYEKGLANLISSIENYYGIKNDKKTIQVVDEALKNNYKNIILVLYDGFGYNILKKNKELAPFLNKNLVDKISSVFPSTTTAATQTIVSGLTPYEHGWLGWDMYMKKYDEVISLFLNTEKESALPIEGYTSTYEELPIMKVTDKISKLNGCKGTIVSSYGDVTYTDIDDMNDQIVNISKNDKKNYIYAYYSDPDCMMHITGTDSDEAKEMFSMIDSKFKELCDSLEDSLVIMIADHGHINTEWITLTDYPAIIEMLKGTTAIDSRASSFRVKDEYLEVFPKIIKEIIKDDFLLLSKKEVCDKKIFGNGNKNKLFDDAVGDFIAVAISNKAIRYSDKHKLFKSAHAGITEDEVYVPLVMVKKKKDN